MVLSVVPTVYKLGRFSITGSLYITTAFKCGRRCQIYEAKSQTMYNFVAFIGSSPICILESNKLSELFVLVSKGGL